MHEFNYSESPIRSLTPEIVQSIAAIHEHKGNHEKGNCRKVSRH